MLEGRLLLINPWQTYEKKLESEYQSYIPYGLACIAAIGESESFITRIVDCLEDETTTEIGDKVRYGKTPAEVEKIIKEFNLILLELVQLLVCLKRMQQKSQIWLKK